MCLAETIWVYRIQYPNGKSLYLVEDEDRIIVKSGALLSESIGRNIQPSTAEGRVNVNFFPRQNFIISYKTFGQCFPLTDEEISALTGLLEGIYERQN